MEKPVEQDMGKRGREGKGENRLESRGPGAQGRHPSTPMEVTGGREGCAHFTRMASER